ncbi:MAG: hypothetical protein ACR2M1_10785 [Gemmatimonadaceae bacterium]
MLNNRGKGDRLDFYTFATDRLPDGAFGIGLFEGIYVGKGAGFALLRRRVPAA